MYKRQAQPQTQQQAQPQAQVSQNSQPAAIAPAPQHQQQLPTMQAATIAPQIQIPLVMSSGQFLPQQVKVYIWLRETIYLY